MKPRLIVAIWWSPACQCALRLNSRAPSQGGRAKGRQNDLGDKAKSQIYCDIVKLGEQIEETDPKDTKKADKLYQQVDELATKLGPEYIALMNGLQDMDPDSEDGKEIGSTLEALDKLCAK
jgi:hypothetical protein